MKQTQKKKRNIALRSFAPDVKALLVIRCITLGLALLGLLSLIWYKPYQLLITLMVALLSGWEILWGAFQEIYLRRFHRGQLIFIVSSIIVFALGHRIEACVALLIAAIGFWLREIGRQAAGQGLHFYQSLLQLQGRVRDNNRYVYPDATTLAPGTIIEVLSGEIVPADGVVVSGGGTLDYSAWLLRPQTVEIQEGAPVYCGAVNHGAPIHVRVTASGKYSLAQKMHRAVLSALEHRSTVQTVLSKISWPFGALMLLLSLIVGVLFPLCSLSSWREGLYQGACVIALAGMGEIVVSVSLAFAAGIAALSRQGVLFKSCRQVMLLRRITDIIFSKTGTLTQRQFRVKEIVPHNQFTKEQLLYYAAAAEQISDHWIAAAIMKEAGEIELPQVQHELRLDSEGVCVQAEDKRIYVGNDQLMHRAGIDALPYHGLGMVCYVAVEDKYIGCIILNDPIKSTAAESIRGLFRLGIHSIDLVTGDKRANAESVGAALGLHRIFSQLSKKEKEEVVAQNLRKGKHGGRLAFVGDESDEGCLKAADISFSLTTLEDNFAGSSADIVVFSDDPQGVLHSFLLAEKIRRIVSIMLALSGICKVIALVMSLMSMIPFWAVILCEVLLALVGTLLARQCGKL